MKAAAIHKIITYFIAAVWLVNGLFCKVLNFVPRHQLIVARILGDEYSGILIKLIGISEILMTIWILSNYKSHLNTYLQIAIVLSMNVLEYFLAPDFLLWGKGNAVFAVMFAALIYFNEFIIKVKSAESKV